MQVLCKLLLYSVYIKGAYDPMSPWFAYLESDVKLFVHKVLVHVSSELECGVCLCWTKLLTV